MRTWTGCAAAVLCACAAHAQPATTAESATRENGLFGLPAGPIDTPLVTDRPDFTESALAVPIGRLQVEAGLTFSSDDDSDSDLWTLPEVLLRVGVAEDLELRFELPSYAILRNSADEDGLTDSSIGFKWRFIEQDGAVPDLAVIGSLQLPTHEDPFGIDGVHPGVVLAAGWDLSEELAEGYGLGVNLGVSESDNDVGSSVWDASWSIALGVPIDDAWGAYVEYFAESPGTTLSETAHSFGTGLTYLVHTNLQLDFRIGFGLSDEAEDFFTGAGLAYRF
ncbi:MAG: transporter [Phycisphaerales bacterium]